MKPGRWRAWLVAVGIFLVGVFIGTAGTTMVALRRVREALHAPVSAPSWADRVTGRLAAQLTKELQLTSQEAARVEQVLNGAALNIKEARMRFAHEVSSELRARVAEASEALPAEKRPEFNRLVAARLAKMGFPPSAWEERTSP